MPRAPAPPSGPSRAAAAKPVSTSELLAPLVELLHDNAKPTLAYDVWVILFPQVWGRLSPTEQLELVNPLTAILCKEANLKQAALEPNVVQGWLHALLECTPVPKLPAAMLKYLARPFNCWHLVLPMLRYLALRFPHEPQWYDALAAL